MSTHLPDLDDDDRPVGRVLSRREVLLLLGAAGGVLAAGCAPAPVAPAAATPQSAEAATAVAMQGNPTVAATAAAEVATVAAANTAVPDCVVRPELTEGPYFVDERLERSDIRIEPSDGSVREGLPLLLTFVVSQVANNACTLLQGATVDLWHCDALGVYSGVTDRRFDTTGQTWLRGYQVTDAAGRAQFQTIYPGWYAGRAVHMHFKVRTAAADNSAWEFTSQLFFPEESIAAVYAQAPYAAKGQRDTPNTADSIYRSGGDQLVLSLTPEGSGLAATFHLALDLANADTGRRDGGGF